jgi:hypothetical protein
MDAKLNSMVQVPQCTVTILFSDCGSLLKRPRRKTGHRAQSEVLMCNAKVRTFHRYELCYFLVINTKCAFPSLGL